MLLKESGRINEVMMIRRRRRRGIVVIYLDRRGGGGSVCSRRSVKERNRRCSCAGFCVEKLLMLLSGSGDWLTDLLGERENIRLEGC